MRWKSAENGVSQAVIMRKFTAILITVKMYYKAKGLII